MNLSHFKRLAWKEIEDMENQNEGREVTHRDK